MSLQVELEKSGNWLFRYRSYLPLLVLPLFVASLLSFQYLGSRHWINELWQMICLLVSLAGLAVRIKTVGHAPIGTSGRNTKAQVAATITTTGMYSVVRHPLYLGNYLMMAGFTMLFHVWWLVLIVTLGYALYYERIMLAEEGFLRARFGDEFEKWAAVTPAFIPKLHGWKTPKYSFCWKTILQREKNGLVLITTVFSVFDLMADSVAQKQLTLDVPWLMVLFAGLAVYFVLRFIKKQTQLLNVVGR